VVPFRRIIAFLLVLCLVADPVTASSFNQTFPVCIASVPNGLFQQQALLFVNVFTRRGNPDDKVAQTINREAASLRDRASLPNPFTPYRGKVIEPLPMTSQAERILQITKAGFNLFELPSQYVTIDLLTDSGTGAISAAQQAAGMKGDEAYAGSSSFEDLRSTIQDLLGFSFVLPAHQGRGAEQVFNAVMVNPGQVVIANRFFDTTRAHIRNVRGVLEELPVRNGRNPEDHHPFKGNIDVAQLRDVLREKHGNVAYILLTLTDNMGGGQPVSLENIRAVKKLADAYKLPLFGDVARFAENAMFIKQRETGYADHSIREIVNEMMSPLDGVLMSAKKEGLVPMGGFIAVRDRSLYDRLVPGTILREGYKTYGGMSGANMAALAQGLREVVDESYLNHRLSQARYLGEKLKAFGIPVVEPIGGHAVYIDAKKMLPQIPPEQFPAQALGVELYLEGGIRGVEVGSLLANKVADHELLRLAIPRRVYDNSHFDYVADCMKRVYERRDQIRGLRIINNPQPPELRHFTAQFERTSPSPSFSESGGSAGAPAILPKPPKDERGYFTLPDASGRRNQGDIVAGRWRAPNLERHRFQPMSGNPGHLRRNDDSYKPRQSLPSAAPSRVKILLIQGPSGAGKTTLIQELVSRHPDQFVNLRRVTTRPPRPGENGGDYKRYLSDTSFDQQVAAGKVIAVSSMHGYRYGIALDELVKVAESGRVVVMEASGSGAELNDPRLDVSLRRIAVLPASPSEPVDQILIARMKARDPDIPSTELANRLQKAPAQMLSLDAHSADTVINRDTPDRIPERSVINQFEAYALRDMAEWKNERNPNPTAAGLTSVSEQPIGESSMTKPVIDPRSSIPVAGPTNKLIEHGYVDRTAYKIISPTPKLLAMLSSEDRQWLQRNRETDLTLPHLDIDGKKYIVTFYMQTHRYTKSRYVIRSIKGPEGTDTFKAHNLDQSLPPETSDDEPTDKSLARIPPDAVNEVIQRAIEDGRAIAVFLRPDWRTYYFDPTLSLEARTARFQESFLGHLPEAASQIMAAQLAIRQNVQLLMRVLDTLDKTVKSSKMKDMLLSRRYVILVDDQPELASGDILGHSGSQQSRFGWGLATTYVPFHSLLYVRNSGDAQVQDGFRFVLEHENRHLWQAQSGDVPTVLIDGHDYSSDEEFAETHIFWAGYARYLQAVFRKKATGLTHERLTRRLETIAKLGLANAATHLIQVDLLPILLLVPMPAPRNRLSDWVQDLARLHPKETDHTYSVYIRDESHAKTLGAILTKPSDPQSRVRDLFAIKTAPLMPGSGVVSARIELETGGSGGAGPRDLKPKYPGRDPGEDPMSRPRMTGPWVPRANRIHSLLFDHRVRHATGENDPGKPAAALGSTRQDDRTAELQARRHDVIEGLHALPSGFYGLTGLEKLDTVVKKEQDGFWRYVEGPKLVREETPWTHYDIVDVMVNDPTAQLVRHASEAGIKEGDAPGLTRRTWLKMIGFLAIGKTLQGQERPGPRLTYSESVNTILKEGGQSMGPEQAARASRLFDSILSWKTGSDYKNNLKAWKDTKYPSSYVMATFMEDELAIESKEDEVVVRFVLDDQPVEIFRTTPDGRRFTQTSHPHLKVFIHSKFDRLFLLTPSGIFVMTQTAPDPDPTFAVYRRASIEEEGAPDHRELVASVLTAAPAGIERTAATDTIPMILLLPFMLAAVVSSGAWSGSTFSANWNLIAVLTGASLYLLYAFWPDRNPARKGRHRGLLSVAFELLVAWAAGMNFAAAIRHPMFLLKLAAVWAAASLAWRVGRSVQILWPEKVWDPREFFRQARARGFSDETIGSAILQAVGFQDSPEALFNLFQKMEIIPRGTAYKPKPFLRMMEMVWDDVESATPAVLPRSVYAEDLMASQTITVGERTFHIFGINHGLSYWTRSVDPVHALISKLKKDQVPLYAEQELQASYRDTYMTEIRDHEQFSFFHYWGIVLSVLLSLPVSLTNEIWHEIRGRAKGTDPSYLPAIHFRRISRLDGDAVFMARNQEMAVTAFEDVSGSKDVAILCGAAHVQDIAAILWRKGQGPAVNRREYWERSESPFLRDPKRRHPGFGHNNPADIPAAAPGNSDEDERPVSMSDRPLTIDSRVRPLSQDARLGNVYSLADLGVDWVSHNRPLLIQALIRLEKHGRPIPQDEKRILADAKKFLSDADHFPKVYVLISPDHQWVGYAQTTAMSEGVARLDYLAALPGAKGRGAFLLDTVIAQWRDQRVIRAFWGAVLSAEGFYHHVLESRVDYASAALSFTIYPQTYGTLSETELQTQANYVQQFNVRKQTVTSQLANLPSGAYKLSYKLFYLDNRVTQLDLEEDGSWRFAGGYFQVRNTPPETLADMINILTYDTHARLVRVPDGQVVIAPCAIAPKKRLDTIRTWTSRLHDHSNSALLLPLVLAAAALIGHATGWVGGPALAMLPFIGSKRLKSLKGEPIESDPKNQNKRETESALRDEIFGLLNHLSYPESVRALCAMAHRAPAAYRMTVYYTLRTLFAVNRETALAARSVLLALVDHAPWDVDQKSNGDKLSSAQYLAHQLNDWIVMFLAGGKRPRALRHRTHVERSDNQMVVDGCIELLTMIIDHLPGARQVEIFLELTQLRERLLRLPNPTPSMETVNELLLKSNNKLQASRAQPLDEYERQIQEGKRLADLERKPAAAPAIPNIKPPKSGSTEGYVNQAIVAAYHRLNHRGITPMTAAKMVVDALKTMTEPEYLVNIGTAIDILRLANNPAWSRILQVLENLRASKDHSQLPELVLANQEVSGFDQIVNQLLDVRSTSLAVIPVLSLTASLIPGLPTGSASVLAWAGFIGIFGMAYYCSPAKRAILEKSALRLWRGRSLPPIPERMFPAPKESSRARQVFSAGWPITLLARLMGPPFDKAQHEISGHRIVIIKPFDSHSKLVAPTRVIVTRLRSKPHPLTSEILILQPRSHTAWMTLGDILRAIGSIQSRSPAATRAMMKRISGLALFNRKRLSAAAPTYPGHSFTLRAA
jgi:tryptophanase/guanylate kinase